MHVLSENEIAIKAIRLIANYPGLSTTELIKELQKLFLLHPDDTRILKNRNDTYFSQKVRNLEIGRAHV
jgi:DNA polymerase III delta subunit